MFRRLVPLWVIVSTILTGGRAHAQRPFPVDIVPTRTALERLGLERQWSAVIPLVETERVMKITLSGDIVFAQTDYANIHAIEAESGRLLWSQSLGERSGFARGVTANSFAVFATNANYFHALDKKTGRPIWMHNLGTIPTSPPACDEDQAMVGLTSGMIVSLRLKEVVEGDKESKDKGVKPTERILKKPLPSWNWHTGGPMLTRPLPAKPFAVFGAADGRVYVIESATGAALFRIPTGGPIGEGFGTSGTRILLIPSGDNNLYALDLFTAKVMWTFPSGAPIAQEPLVSDKDVYTVNTAGNMSLIDASSGETKWTKLTQGGRLAAISGTKLYLRSYNLDLFMMDRQTGQMLVDPGETYLRAGLKLREYDLDIVNRFNDRLYFATSSGMIVCMRETGQIKPRVHRDPKSPPFGYVPPEGIKPPPVPAAPTDPAAPGADEPAAARDKAKEPADEPK